MKVRGNNRINSLITKNNRAKVAVMLFTAASAAPAIAQSTIAQIETQANKTAASMDSASSPATITAIVSQGAGESYDGYTYTNWAFLANDGTGSMDVYGKLPAGNTEPNPTVGDKIYAVGTYYPFDGIPEVETLTALTNAGSGGSVPSPLTVTIPQLLQLGASTSNANNIQGYLLTLDDVTFSGLTTGGTTLVSHANNTFYATDTSSNSIEMYLYASSYSVCGQLVVNSGNQLPTTAQDVTGLVEIYNSVPEFVPMSWVPTTHTTPPPPTNSTLLTASPLASQIAGSSTTDGIDSVSANGKTVTATVGTYVNTGTASSPNMIFATLKYSSANTTLQLASNGGTVGTDSTYYAVVPDGAHGGAATNYPIPTGSTGTANIGYNPTDTGTPGATLSGSLQIQNSDNGADPTIHVTLNSVKVLEERDLSAGTSTAGDIVGDILVGKTGTTTGQQLITTNTDTNGDFSSDILTNVTLLANSAATPYAETDSLLGGATVATLNATAPSTDQVFGGPGESSSGAFNNAGTSAAPVPGSTSVPGTVNISVTPAISGTFGDDHSETVGSTTATFAANYASFTGAAGGAVGMGLPGESESIYAYAQFSGFQPASVTASATLTSSGGNIILTNAASNDNVATSGGSTVSAGIRDSAWVTSASANQDGWSSNLVPATVGSPDTPGTTISGTQNAPGDTNSYSTTASISYNPASALAGTYTGGTYTIGLENAQVDQNDVVDGGPVQGTSHNDLAPVTVALPTEVGTDTTGAGTYNFGGGTFVASGVTNLTGSFTQTGGSATFNQITGSGALTLTGGTTKLAKGHTTSTLASLAMSPNAQLDITNNTLDVTGGNLATLTALISSAYANGAWTGDGITSSSAASTPGTAVGIKLSGNTVVIKYTWYGDLDLDGTVTGADLALMGTGTGWAHGDLNYDGVVNDDDYALFMLGAADAGVKNINNLPEPSVVSALVLPAIIGLRRRRRA